jgi:hypothetical protein
MSAEVLEYKNAEIHKSQRGPWFFPLILCVLQFPWVMFRGVYIAGLQSVRPVSLVYDSYLEASLLLLTIPAILITLVSCFRLRKSRQYASLVFLYCILAISLGVLYLVAYEWYAEVWCNRFGSWGMW